MADPARKVYQGSRHAERLDLAVAVAVLDVVVAGGRGRGRRRLRGLRHQLLQFQLGIAHLKPR